MPGGVELILPRMGKTMAEQRMRKCQERSVGHVKSLPLPKEMHRNAMSGAVLFTVASNWKHLCPSTGGWRNDHIFMPWNTTQRYKDLIEKGTSELEKNKLLTYATPQINLIDIMLSERRPV